MAITGSGRNYEWRMSVHGDWSGRYYNDASYGLYDPNGSCTGTAMKHPHGQWSWRINNVDGHYYKSGSAPTIEDVVRDVGDIFPTLKGVKIVGAGHGARPISERPDSSFTRYSR